VLGRYSPEIFAAAAVLLLTVALIEAALRVDVPKVVSIVLLAVCMAGLFGTILVEGTGRVYPLGRDSEG